MMDRIVICADCLLPEKLLQRAMEAGVRIIDVGPREKGLRVTVDASDARRFLKLCQRFSIPARVVRRRGVSAFAAWLSRRWTVLAGLVAGLIACGWFLSRLWVVDIAFIGDAAASGDAPALRALLESMDIRPGIPRNLDTGALSEALLARSGELSYVSAQVEGVRLTVEAAPEVPAPEVYDVETPRNLYADRDGIVVAVNAEAGQSCVKPGDVVRRGQLLILGEEKIAKEVTRPIAALGSVTVRTWIEGSAEGSTRAAQARYTGRQSVSASLQTPWLEIPIAEGERFKQQATETDALPIGGLYLPLTLTRVTRRETEFVESENDRALLTGRLSALALADARARLALNGPTHCEITRCWVRFTDAGGDTLRASAACEILTDAATPGEAPPQGG